MSLRERLARILAPARFATVTSRVDDSAGWNLLTSRPHERDSADISETYADALTAWRKNPLAKRIVDIQIDYILGEGITITSPFKPLDDFITAFWNHPKNHIDTRLPVILAELTRAGDIFPILFRNPGDGMSYIRFITKDEIQQITTAPNDWETELTYHQRNPEPGGDPIIWYSPDHPSAGKRKAVMMHFSINRPMGALLGEGDLTTMLPWLLRYSRMLEDRIRLHWAARAFLWLVTVPSHKIAEKREQYRTPPEAGSIIVKDTAETWEVSAPLLHAADAEHDLTAVRRMVDAGAGIPPHWRGEPENATLATAEAMQAPAERHLRQRQKDLVSILTAIITTAYQRQPNAAPLPTHNPHELYTVILPDITRTDNVQMADAISKLTTAIATLAGTDLSIHPELNQAIIGTVFTVMGQPPTQEQLKSLINTGNQPQAEAITSE